MATQWNTPLWDNTQPGTADNTAPFPELYLRQFINDMGCVPNELTPGKSIIDIFTAIVDEFQFTTNFMPSINYDPIVYKNGVPQVPNIDYSINGRIVTFPNDGVSAGDVIKIRYSV